NRWLLLPVGLLLGVVLAFGRLYHDSEMAAALACGVGPANLYLPVALLAVLGTAGLAWLTLLLAPDATARALSLRSAALRAGQFAPLSPGKFRIFSGGNVVVYAHDINPDGTLAGVFVERNRGALVEVALAVPPARLTPRQGRDARVWLAVVIFFLYVDLISVGKVWIARGTIPEFLGRWLPHAAVVLLARMVIVGPGLSNRLRYRVRGL